MVGDRQYTGSSPGWAIGARGSELLRESLVGLVGSLWLLACTEPRFRPDAGAPDASASAGEDAGAHADAGRRGEPPDAEVALDAQPPRDAGSLCGMPGAVDTPGDDCARDVACGNAKTCDLTRNNCCIDRYGSDQCTAAPTCNDGRQRARCDGPDDCAGGQVCCFDEGATVCADACPAAYLQLCHRDADCPERATCVVGRDENVPFFDRLYVWWGFCGEAP